MEKRKIKPFKAPSHDIMLRIYAVVFAVIVWFVMSITMYPTIEKTIHNVPVSISVEGSYADEQQLLPIDFDEVEVTARLKGMRYEIGNYSADDLVATVSVDEVTRDGTYELPITVTSKNGTELEVLSVNPSTVKVRFDYIATQSFDITAEAPNIRAGTGYMLDSVTASPQSVTITGAQEDMDRITRVVVKSSQSGELSESLSISNAELVLYDGNTVLDNDNYEFSRTNFSIEAQIYMLKTVPLTFEYQDVPNGFDVSSLSYTLSQETITIAAPTSLEALDSWNLGYIKIKDIGFGSNEKEFEISLPSSYRNISNLEKVQVSFDDTNWATKTIAIDYSQIHVINSPGIYDISVESAGVGSIVVMGPSEVVEEITASDFIGEISLLGVSVNEGTTAMSMTVYAPDYDNVWCVGSYSAAISLKAREYLFSN